MVGVQLRERGGSRVAEFDARFGQHEIEVGPASLLIVGRANRVAGVNPFLGQRLGLGHPLGLNVDPTPRQRVTDPVPVRIDEHAASIEEDGLNRHRFSLHLREV